MIDDERLKLTLFVAGESAATDQALTGLRQALDDGSVSYDLDVVDVRSSPDLADSAVILATPTLVREAPTPTRRLIGDLSDTPRVLRSLDVDVPPGARATT